VKTHTTPSKEVRKEKKIGCVTFQGKMSICDIKPTITLEIWEVRKNWSTNCNSVFPNSKNFNLEIDLMPYLDCPDPIWMEKIEKRKEV
jgi:hypothetical protein